MLILYYTKDTGLSKKGGMELKKNEISERNDTD